MYSIKNRHPHKHPIIMKIRKLHLESKELCAMMVIFASTTLCVTGHRRSYTVTTVIEEPYVMNRASSSTDNHMPSYQSGDYEGYIIDLLNILADDLNFRYSIIPVFDGQYSIKRRDDSWGGMIGELHRKHADIAAGALFETEQRSEVVDFTEPFIYVNGCLVMRKTETGVLSQINSVEDLLFNKHDVQFGTVDKGIIRKNFKKTRSGVEKLLYKEMMKDSKYSSFTKSNAEGLENVRREDYVFIMPDNIAKYMASRKPCDLKVVDNFLMSEGLRLAVQKGSDLQKRINYRLERMRLDGTLDKLYKKWWIDKSQCQKNNTGGINEPHQSSASGACKPTINFIIHFTCTFCICIYEVLLYLLFQARTSLSNIM